MTAVQKNYSTLLMLKDFHAYVQPFFYFLPVVHTSMEHPRISPHLSVCKCTQSR